MPSPGGIPVGLFQGPAVLLDPCGRVLGINPQATALLGRSGGERPWRAWLPRRADRRRALEAWLRSERAGAAFCEFEALGENRPVAVTAVLLRLAGGRVLAAGEPAPRPRDACAVGVAEVVTRLAHGLVHLLGNLLMGLRTAPDPGPVVREVEGELARLVDRFREFLTVGDGLTAEPGRILAEVAAEAGLAPPEIPACPAAALPPPVLRTILREVVRNACEAAGAGGRVRLRAETADGGAVIRIRHEDARPAPCVLAAAGLPFFSTRRRRPAGLGLLIADALLTRAGGSLSFSACPGGSQVVLRLPAAPAAVRNGRPGVWLLNLPPALAAPLGAQLALWGIPGAVRPLPFPDLAEVADLPPPKAVVIGVLQKEQLVPAVLGALERAWPRVPVILVGARTEEAGPPYRVAVHDYRVLRDLLRRLLPPRGPEAHPGEEA